MCVYIYIYVCVCVCVCIYMYMYVYIYIEREREPVFWGFHGKSKHTGGSRAPWRLVHRDR